MSRGTVELSRIEELVTPAPASVIGDTVAVVVGALSMLRAPATLWAATRWLIQAVPDLLRMRRRSPGADPTGLLRVEGRTASARRFGPAPLDRCGGVPVKISVARM